ncbi:MAG: hypothetical protein R2800_13935 [Flavipsychrobacter sp.]
MIAKRLTILIVFIILTLLTQVGGLLLVLTLLLHCIIAKRYKRVNFIGAKTLLFILIYFTFTFVLIPPIAKHFGRVPLPFGFNKGNLKPQNPFTFLLNRHYVTKDLHATITTACKIWEGQHKGETIHYLDANFPFINGFPLIPHLSHDDGKKLDFAFLYYDTLHKKPSNSTPSYFGYGVYAEPEEGEINTTIKCETSGYWQYGLLGKILPRKKNTNLILDEARTRAFLLILSKEATISKIFIEPYLKTRLDLRHINKIRFHGCQAVRHDDHIHIQQ